MAPRTLRARDASRRAKENTWEHCWQLNIGGIRVTVWLNVATAGAAVWT
jgi:hypothetical protein